MYFNSFCLFLFYIIHFFGELSSQVIVSPVNDSDMVPISRVVNGWPAKLGDVPYQVALKSLKSQKRKLYYTICGASIIAPTKLISAAHCFKQKSKCTALFQESIVIESSQLRKLYAVAGNLLNEDVFRSADSIDSGQWRRLKKVIYPSQYKFPKHDIAVVMTVLPFNFNENVAPIPYSSVHINYKGTCLVSGYGRTSSKKYKVSDVLLIAKLKLISTYKCNRIYNRNTKRMICTSTKVTDVAKGDSGGPLVCSNTSDPNESSKLGILVGVVSGGSRQASFFTRVSSYYKYIECNSAFEKNQDILCFVPLIYSAFSLFSFYFI